MSGSSKGVWAAVAAFGLWGILPIYWKQLEFFPAMSIVAQRTCWTCIVLWPLVLFWKNMSLPRQPQLYAWHLLSGLLIGSNWVLYVWATINDRMIEGALGYYINPFFNILFGALWFGEKQRPLQLAAVGVAACGVLLQIPGVGHFPWVALSLALTFSLYGVVRKRSPVGALDGLTIETTLLVPLALGWLLLHHATVPEAFGGNWVNAWWIIGTGVATAIPLLCFGFASQNIRLGTLGMLQFIGPTCQFFIGWLMYGEPMAPLRFVSFGLIWLAVAIYSWDSIRGRKKYPENGS